MGSDEKSSDEAQALKWRSKSSRFSKQKSAKNKNHFRNRSQYASENKSDAKRKTNKNIKYRGPKKLKSKQKLVSKRRHKKRSVSQHHISMKPMNKSMRNGAVNLKPSNGFVSSLKYAASTASNESGSVLSEMDKHQQYQLMNEMTKLSHRVNTISRSVDSMQKVVQ